MHDLSEYLQGVPSLLDEQLERAQLRQLETDEEQALNAAIANLTMMIRQARKRYELRTGLLIIPEPGIIPGVGAGQWHYAAR